MILYALANDIDGNGYNDFIPIGSNKDKSEYFIGMLNGLGHTISNINIIATNDDNRYLYGLFGESNGDISNLNLKNINININNSNFPSQVGLLCGSASGNIRNIFAEGNIWANYANIGGLVGNSSGEISNCSTVVNIISRMEGSKNYKYSIGGIAGINEGYINSSATNNKLSISGGDFEFGIDIGGFIGTNFGRINNAYAISNMNLDILSYTVPAIGGFVGYAHNSGTISDSYCNSSFDTSISPYDIGGFVGTAINQSKFYGGFWNTTISNISWPIGFSTGSVGISYLYGLSSSEMHEQSNYKGRLDFNNVWRFNEKEGYPELRYVAKNVISLSPVESGIPPEKPNKPVDPTPPIVDPDPDPRHRTKT